jgi:hypothetical protein
MIVKARGVKYMAKSFTLPDVQVGSILEYYYTTDLSEKFIFNSRWILSNELFTKNAKFSLKPYTSSYVPVNVRWTWNLLPPGTAQPAEAPDHVINLQVSDVPAFQTEDYMPPENELKSRVDFIYSEEGFENDPDKYWRKLGKKRNDQLESFVGKRKAMEHAVAEIVSPGDSPEVKLQKIYARVQQIRNTSYELQKSEQELKRDKEKDPGNVEAIWKKQYGNGQELTWLFLALARAAGFEASGMWLADRSNYFFIPQTMDGRRLDANVVVVKLNGKDVFFDPGAAFTPFGMLPSAMNSIQRTGKLTLDPLGTLKGEVSETRLGDRASSERWRLHNVTKSSDQIKPIEDLLAGSLSLFSITHASIENLNHTDQPFGFHYSFEAHNYAKNAGGLLLLRPRVLGVKSSSLLETKEPRKFPIEFDGPSRDTDTFEIEIPPGYVVDDIPPAVDADYSFASYHAKTEVSGNLIHYSRTLEVKELSVPVSHADDLKKFYRIIAGDERNTVVLKTR